MIFSHRPNTYDLLVSFFRDYLGPGYQLRSEQTAEGLALYVTYGKEHGRLLVRAIEIEAAAIDGRAALFERLTRDLDHLAWELRRPAHLRGLVVGVAGKPRSRIRRC